MMLLYSEIKEGGINFIDIGCSGNFDPKWNNILHLLNYTGFDPNKEECHRLSSLPSKFKNVRYLPFAIGGSVGPATMYLTESKYCNSLLKPRTKWLKRFKFRNLFNLIGEEAVECVTLDHLQQAENIQADIIKIDSQGLELPILKSSRNVLERAFCVETETGFIENYVGETVLSQIDKFLRDMGFLMFDINIHRVARDNPLANISLKQPIWCETLWFKDYLSNESWDISATQPNREEAIKAIYLSNVLGFSDYSFELFELFRRESILNERDIQHLSDMKNWDIPHRKNQNYLTYGLRWLTNPILRIIRDSAIEALSITHPLKRERIKTLETK